MQGVYRTVLGGRFDDLPPVLRKLHDSAGSRNEGTLDVRWNASPVVRFMLWVAGMPRPGVKLPCTVDIVPNGKNEIWRRKIGRSSMSSAFRAISSGVVRERMGVLNFDLSVYVSPSRSVVQRSRRVTWLMIPLPIHIFSREAARNGERMRCDIRVYLRGVGCLFRYCGSLRVTDR